MSKTVKNYTEYTKLLKTTFGGYEKMPELTEVQAFIDKYSLFNDWKILLLEVNQDIRTLILKPKARIRSPREKWVSSYKQYLELLHDIFGIPEVMPEASRISAFIDEYDLSRVWGITKDDVTDDLQSFIDGKYDEMHRDSMRVHKPVTRVITKQRPVTPVIHHTTNSTYSYKHTPQTRIYTSPVAKQEPPKRTETTKPKKPVVKKPAIEVKATVFIDGDNHIKEGQKGIERLPEETKVRAIFSQPGAQRKFDIEFEDLPNVSSKLVEPGDQAVDNQIKTEAGQLMRQKNQDITIISHDKGFVEFRDRKNNGKNGNRITVAKSVEDRYPKNKKKQK